MNLYGIFFIGAQKGKAIVEEAKSQVDWDFDPRFKAFHSRFFKIEEDDNRVEIVDKEFTFAKYHLEALLFLKKYRIDVPDRTYTAINSFFAEEYGAMQSKATTLYFSQAEETKTDEAAPATATTSATSSSGLFRW